MKIYVQICPWMLLMLPLAALGQVGKDFGQRADFTRYATSGAEGLMSEMLMKSLGKPVNTYANTRIKGSRYFDEFFNSGTVYYREKPVDTLYMRYDAYQDEIQIRRSAYNEEPVQALLRNSDIRAVIEQQAVQYLGYYTEDAERVQGYLFQLVSPGPYGLYVRKSKTLREGKVSGNSLARSVAPRYTEEIDYYLSQGDNMPLKPIPERKKKFLKLLPDAVRLKMQSRMEAMDYKLENESDLTQLVHMMNEISGTKH